LSFAGLDYENCNGSTGKFKKLKTGSWLSASLTGTTLDVDVSITAGTGISLSGSCGSKTIAVSLSSCQLTDHDCVTAVQYDHTIHGGMYAKRLSDGKFIPILANEVDVVTSVEWDDSNHKLKFWYRTLYMPALDVSGSTSTDIVVFDPDCPGSGGE
jgi:hypothetical protein